MTLLVTIFLLAVTGLISVSYLHAVNYHDWLSDKFAVAGVVFFSIAGWTAWLIVNGETNPAAAYLIILVGLGLFSIYYGAVAIRHLVDVLRTKGHEAQQQAYNKKIQKVFNEHPNPTSK